MEDEDILPRSGARRDAASLLSGEALDAYSLEELDERIRLLAAETERVRAHRIKAEAHRRAAEALFRPNAG
ncbi:MAG TPA: DUF1192 family protein [Novosphingobium sp.]|nr:DUF1192 family protein [Novosphingobium sp.]HZV10345.1 DUF1192 family protein [Novosphingobium sp.]